MLFRQHRGSLDDALTTQVELADTFAALHKHIQNIMPLWRISRDDISVVFYTHDTRLAEWQDTFIITLKHYGVIGFCNHLPQ